MYRRSLSVQLEQRLTEPRRFMQVVMGPRQTGKTTAINQAIKATGIPYQAETADGKQDLGSAWIDVAWRQARQLAKQHGVAALILDEIQKVPEWSETVKRLWDEDTWEETPLHVVLSGSSSLLLKAGISDSLAGRFELLCSTHWAFAEMQAAFGYTLDEYLQFGGYPGAAALRHDKPRWTAYMRDSIIEATISRDILQMEEIRKPALMRALFELGAQYSGQELSYRKILGQLDNRGNTDTLKHYLTLLDGAGMLSGLQKYDDKQLRSRASSPRLLVHDPSLMTASWHGTGSLLEQPDLQGHLVESAVGATLLARSKMEGFDLCWWRDGSLEVDFVIKRGDDLSAIEVKSGRIKKSGIGAFCQRHSEALPIIVGSRNTPLDAFLHGDVPLFTLS